MDPIQAGYLLAIGLAGGWALDRAYLGRKSGKDPDYVLKKLAKKRDNLRSFEAWKDQLAERIAALRDPKG